MARLPAERAPPPVPVSAGAALGAAAHKAPARALLAIGIAVGGGAVVVRWAPRCAERIGARSDLAIDLAVYLPCILLALGGAALLRRRILPGWSGHAAAAAMLGAGGFAVALALAALGGQATLRAGAPLAPAAYAIGSGIFVLGAFGEELLFRGFLQPQLIEAWGAIGGVILAAAGFLVLHLAGGWQAPLAIANIFLAGLWFGVLALRTGGIAAPFLAHAGWNWAEALLFGASPNPGVDPAGSIFDVELGGAAWLGGSGDGMNGAVATTIVLAVLILLTVRAGAGRRRGARMAVPASEGPAR